MFLRTQYDESRDCYHDEPMMSLCMVKNPKKLNGLMVFLLAVSARVATMATIPSATAARRTTAMSLDNDTLSSEENSRLGVPQSLS